MMKNHIETEMWEKFGNLICTVQGQRSYIKKKNGDK